MAQSGLLEWANYIRITMANDPGRKLFQEQVQTHGFSFLDDYLDNILSGAKQDPLIELVKTPGRKKAISRKPKLASKLTQVVGLSLETDEEDVAAEPATPVNSLTQALLNAKSRRSNTVDPTDGSQKLSQDHTPDSTKSGNLDLLDQSAISIHASGVELSVIAEDDEGTEGNRGSSHIKRSLMHDENGGGSQGSIMSGENPSQDVNLSGYPISSSNDALSPKSQDNAFGLSRLPGKSVEEAISKPLDMTVPIRDPDAALSSPPLSARKGVLSTLPTLPEPIPLRKSVRSTKDTVVNTVMLGAATPGNAAVGKRTSWLMKAREAKAMEGIPKKSATNYMPPPTPGLIGKKRRSDETIEPTDSHGDERQPKAPKQQKDDTAPTKATSMVNEVSPESVKDVAASDQDRMLDMLRKKVQGLEARNDKLSSKVSEDAAAALAVARAQAEARIAQRNHQDEIPVLGTNSDNASESTPDQTPPEEQRRFSISDLFPVDSKIKDKSKVPQKTASFEPLLSKPDPSNYTTSNNESTSTTPPHSPPAQLPLVKPAYVFNKPPPVFIPPVTAGRSLPTPPALKETSFALPPLPTTFSKPASMALGISPRLGSPPGDKKSKATPLSAQSTMESVQSDDLFGDRGITEAWVPNTQDTEYSSAFGSQQPGQSHSNALDDDDSWPIDEKLPQGVHWPFGAQSKEDSMTWSTLPSQSQRIETGPITKGTKDREQNQSPEDMKKPGPGGLDEDMDIEHEDYNTGAEAIPTDPELEELILSGASLASKETEGNRGQASLASSVSSQSQVGFLGSASRFLSSALGTSKKGKPEMKKVLHMAAAAAKKQQQEDDKKAARLKEMENRRQLALQRKAEEEQARQQERERKAKEETEKRKREREEQAEKKTVKPIVPSSSFRKDEEIAKKRKVEQEKMDKKPEPKKQTPLSKTGFKPTSSKQANALSSSATYNASQSQSTVPTTILKTSEKPTKVPSAIPTKGKIKSTPRMPQVEEDHAQPSQIIQTQMAARAKAAMQTEPRVPSESIELPEVNSEYSDSDDEDRPRTFNPPGWAQSPELHQALQAQSTINPDDIFGAIRPLRMEEMFKARTSRFRARTSSANWSGVDRLTVEEEREYARRMGFK